MWPSSQPLLLLLFRWVGANQACCRAGRSDDFTASGLLYLSELIEEHSRVAKLVGERGIYVCVFNNVRRFANGPMFTGNNRASCATVPGRLAASVARRVLRGLSRCLSSKLFCHLARDLTYIDLLRIILRFGYSRPLPLVLPLFSPGELQQAREDVPGNRRSILIRLRRNCNILRAVCLACPSVPFPKSQRQ